MTGYGAYLHAPQPRRYAPLHKKYSLGCTFPCNFQGSARQYEGEIFPAGIFRSREKGKARLVELTRRHLASCGEDVDNYRFVIGYGYDRAEAEAFRDDMLAMLREACGLTSLGVFQIGATIGVHTGPHPIGIGLLRRA